jgi:hypothetical protein
MVIGGHAHRGYAACSSTAGNGRVYAGARTGSHHLTRGLRSHRELPAAKVPTAPTTTTTMEARAAVRNETPVGQGEQHRQVGGCHRRCVWLPRLASDRSLALGPVERVDGCGSRLVGGSRRTARPTRRDRHLDAVVPPKGVASGSLRLASVCGSPAGVGVSTGAGSGALGPSVPRTWRRCVPRTIRVPSLRGRRCRVGTGSAYVP